MSAPPTVWDAFKEAVVFLVPAPVVIVYSIVTPILDIWYEKYDVRPLASWNRFLAVDIPGNS